MTMTAPQTTALANLDTAISAALAVANDSDGNYDRALAERCSGLMAAIEIREPNWTGHKAVADPYQAWSAAHPSHP